MDFMYAIDGARYGGFVAEILNDISKGAIGQPGVINDVFTLANNRVVISKHTTTRNIGASFATIDDEARRGREAARKLANKTPRQPATTPKVGDTPKSDARGGDAGGGGGGGGDDAEKKKAKRKARKAKALAKKIADSNCFICG